MGTAKGHTVPSQPVTSSGDAGWRKPWKAPPRFTRSSRMPFVHRAGEGGAAEVAVVPGRVHPQLTHVVAELLREAESAQRLDGEPALRAGAGRKRWTTPFGTKT